MSSNFLKGIIVFLLILLVGVAIVFGYIFFNVLPKVTNNTARNSPVNSVANQGLQQQSENASISELTIKDEVLEVIDADTADALISFGELIKNIDIDTYIDFSDKQALFATMEHPIPNPDTSDYSEKGEYYGLFAEKPELNKYSKREYNALYSQSIEAANCAIIWNNMSMYCHNYWLYAYRVADYIDAEDKNAQIQEKYKGEAVNALRGLEKVKAEIMSNFVGYGDRQKSNAETSSSINTQDELPSQDEPLISQDESTSEYVSSENTLELAELFAEIEADTNKTAMIDRSNNVFIVSSRLSVMASNSFVYIGEYEVEDPNVIISDLITGNTVTVYAQHIAGDDDAMSLSIDKSDWSTFYRAADPNDVMGLLTEYLKLDIE